MFKRTIGLNILEMSYDVLLSLGMMMDVDILKCDGQYSKSIHALAMFIMLLRYNKFLTISLKCLQDSLSGLGVESLLQLWMDNKNSSFKKGVHLVVGKLFRIFSNNKTSTC